jgi:DNA segregation ATPase FtsK/SpoIIIE-like protein
MASRTNVGSVTGTSTNGAWVRSRGQVEDVPSNGRLTRLLGEARWIVGALLALALFAMLITYSKSDPSFTHAVSSTNVANLGGRVGAWVADIALLLFGLSAYLLVFGPPE